VAGETFDSVSDKRLQGSGDKEGTLSETSSSAAQSVGKTGVSADQDFG